MANARLLVVDDDPFVSALLEQILVSAGYHVTLAADGQAALDLFRTAPAFDTVLLDRQMPGLDGLAVLRHMKATPELKDIPVVLQTTLGNAAEVAEGLKAGALYYLVKPLDARLVGQVVAAAIREFAARRAFWAELEGTRSALGLIRRGVFHYQTLAQCQDLTALLAKACPDPKRMVVGLSELMINALEHGNLGITYPEKTALLEANTWAEEVERRQRLPEHRHQWVRVGLVRAPDRVRFRIQDQGLGFAWEDFQSLNPDRMFDSHGRGILLARWETFDRVTYLGSGNCVVAETDCDLDLAAG